MQQRDFSKQWWWRMLVFSSVFYIVFGLVMVFLPDLTQWYFNSLIFARPDSPFDAAATGYIVFSFGIIGSVIFGWGIGLLMVVLVPLRRGERWAWWMLTGSVMSWFLLDSTYSVLMGYGANAVSNVAFVVLYVIPLIAAYRALHANQPIPVLTKS